MQAAQKEASVIQQAVRGNQLVKQMRQKDESVNQTNELQDETGKIKDKQSNNNQERENQQEGRGEEGAEHRRGSFSDPALGKNIDISG